MSGEHDHCPVCGDDMCDGTHDAKPRTCRTCKHYQYVRPAPQYAGWHSCQYPVPPWVQKIDSSDHNYIFVEHAESCPCYSHKESNP